TPAATSPTTPPASLPPTGLDTSDELSGGLFDIGPLFGGGFFDFGNADTTFPATGTGNDTLTNTSTSQTIGSSAPSATVFNLTQSSTSSDEIKSAWNSGGNFTIQGTDDTSIEENINLNINRISDSDGDFTGNLTVIMGAGNDFLFSAKVKNGDSIDLGSGDDMISIMINSINSGTPTIADCNLVNLDGGPGDDTLNFEESGNNTTELSLNTCGAINFENIFGTAGSETINGDNNANLIRGGKVGNNTIFGYGGNDTIYGYGNGVSGDLCREDIAMSINENHSSNFVQTLYGGDGDDKLWGAAGDDVIDGGPGNDIIEEASGRCSSQDILTSRGNDTHCYSCW
ncbi:MAG: calcium-binding protein, partial [Gammaproteobacteria bacterium]